MSVVKKKKKRERERENTMISKEEQKYHQMAVDGELKLSPDF